MVRSILILTLVLQATYLFGQTGFKIPEITYLDKESNSIGFRNDSFFSDTYRGIDSVRITNNIIQFYNREMYYVSKSGLKKKNGDDSIKFVDTSAILTCRIIRADSQELILALSDDITINYFSKYIGGMIFFNETLFDIDDYRDSINNEISNQIKNMSHIDTHALNEFINNMEEELDRPVIHFYSPKHFLDTINFQKINCSYELQGYYASTKYDLQLYPDGRFYLYKYGRSYVKKRRFKKYNYSYAYSGILNKSKMDSIQMYLNTSGVFKLKKILTTISTHTAEIHLEINCEDRMIQYMACKSAFPFIMLPLINELIHIKRSSDFTKNSKLVCIPLSFREDLKSVCDKK